MKLLWRRIFALTVKVFWSGKKKRLKMNKGIIAIIVKLIWKKLQHVRIAEINSALFKLVERKIISVCFVMNSNPSLVSTLNLSLTMRNDHLTIERTVPLAKVVLISWPDFSCSTWVISTPSLFFVIEYPRFNVDRGLTVSSFSTLSAS